MSNRPCYQILKKLKKLEKLMHKRLHTFADNKNIIFDLLVKVSHALTNITGSIRKALDDENICFAGLRKAFDTVYFKIPVAKLNDYGICGVALV